LDICIQREKITLTNLVSTGNSVCDRRKQGLSIPSALRQERQMAATLKGLSVMNENMVLLVTIGMTEDGYREILYTAESTKGDKAQRNSLSPNVFIYNASIALYYAHNLHRHVFCRILCHRRAELTVFLHLNRQIYGLYKLFGLNSG